MFEYVCDLMLKEKAHSIIALLSAIVFINIYGLILVSNTLYYHSHVTPDGEVISHAHPFNKQNDNQPRKSHHHSKLELLLLFSDNYNLDEIQTETEVLSITHFDKNVDYNSVSIISIKYSQDSSRAPPSRLMLLG